MNVVGCTGETVKRLLPLKLQLNTVPTEFWTDLFEAKN